MASPRRHLHHFVHDVHVAVVGDEPRSDPLDLVRPVLVSCIYVVLVN
jgi:hypothetical protein